MSNEAPARPTFDPPCSNFLFSGGNCTRDRFPGTEWRFFSLPFCVSHQAQKRKRNPIRPFVVVHSPPLNSSLPPLPFFGGPGDRPPSRPKSPSFPSSFCRRRLHFGSVESTAFSRPYRSRRRERENRRLPASQSGRKLFEGRGTDRVVEMTALRFRNLREIRPWRGGRPISQKQKRRRRARESQWQIARSAIESDRQN